MEISAADVGLQTDNGVLLTEAGITIDGKDQD